LQTLVDERDPAQVVLPSGRVVGATINSVGRSAVLPSGEQGGTPYVKLELRLHTANTGNLDQAPVEVKITRSKRMHVVAVPLTALLALRAAGFGVEVRDSSGRTRTAPVKTGMYADGYVEVTGIKAGTTVVAAQ
jgi:hypothetical protein